MKTIQEISQWVIDNRYPKSKNHKVSDAEMYHTLIELINKVSLRQLFGELLPSSGDIANAAIDYVGCDTLTNDDIEDAAHFVAGAAWVVTELIKNEHITQNQQQPTTCPDTQ